MHMLMFNESNDTTKRAHEHERKPVNKNGYFWNILMMRIKYS